MTNYVQVIQAAIEAGTKIMEVYNSNDFQIELKNDESPLTLADKKAHLKILEYLEPTNIPILSEEGKEIPFYKRMNWNTLWIVDPLDGTKEFIKRNGEFTVNIALVKEGSPLFGVIYVPITQVLYLGISGVGSFKFEQAHLLNFSKKKLHSIISLGKKLPLHKKRPFTVVASRSHYSIETEALINNLKLEHPDLVLLTKGSSLKLCAIAEGSADIYPRFAPTMEWDTAAGQAIVEAMGGSVKQINGELLKYNKADLYNPWFVVS